jgi:DNA-binding MurR/RpiR family transcriptional regulator
MTPQIPPDDALLRISTAQASMTPAERRIAEHILAAPAAAVEQTISELAAACHTSETTVVRFSRSVGYRGYPELRMVLATRLAHEAARDSRRPVPGTDIGPDDTLREVVDKIGYADVRAVEDTVENLDLDQLARLVEAITGARRIVLFGIGASGTPARDLQRKLYRIGLPASAFEDSHEALAAAGLLGPGDVCIGMSHSGSTPETVKFLAVAGRRGAVTAAVTNAAPSPVADAVDVVLTTAVRESGLRSGAMASRIAQLAVVDCVFVAVAQRAPQETEAALRATFDAVRDLRMEGNPRR